MILGLALFSPLAIAGAIFYILHHIIVKTNLFLIGGMIARHTGTEDLRRCGSLLRSTPLLAVLFLIPALSLGGIPPLSGFWAKYSIVKAGFEAEAFLLTAIALGVGILTLFSMTKIWGEAFWKDRPAGNPPAPDDGASPLLRPDAILFTPVVALAAVTLGLSFFGAPVFELAVAAGEQVLNPQGYIQAVLPVMP